MLVCLLLAGCERPTPVPAPPTPQPPIVLADFAREQNPFGGSAHCEAQNGASLQCAREDNTLHLTYSQVGGGAYVLWWTDLRGADLSHQLLLAVRVRGAQGGERPHLYLNDQSGVRAFVDVARYFGITSDWQTIYVPLQDFQDAKGNKPDLAHIGEFGIAFEFEKQQGSLLVADVRTQATTLVARLTHDSAREKMLSDSVKLPDGFQVSVFADLHLPEITRIGFDPQGRFTFTRRTGQVYRLDGDQLELIASGFDELLGFAWRKDELFLASCHRVTRTRDENGDGFYEHATDLIGDLPCGGHQTNALAFGPDGALYISQGEFNNAPGALLRLNVDAPHSKPDVFATGLRNPYSFIFAPNGDIFASDNGPDDKDGPEELNWIVQGGDYGFPKYFGEPPPNSGTRAPLATFPQHAAAEGVVMYNGNQFPADYRGDVFVALFGQLFTSNIVGHKIVRVKLTKDGSQYHAAVSDFISGLDRPLDLVVGADGALYVDEFLTGVIYRISYGR